MYQNKRIACVIPARDEAPSIGIVINGLQQLQNSEGTPVIDDIVVCDNGSTDSTAQIARKEKAHVVIQPTPGYGLACLTALSEVHNADIVLFMDGDNAFQATQAMQLIDSVANGADLAIGSRSLGNCSKGALTLPQRFGNWLACYLIKQCWNRHVSDLGPFRAIAQQSLQKLQMTDKTFGWTIEMQIKAIQQNMLIVEHPVDTACRIGHSKISGTIKGTIGAGIGILSMIAKLRWRQYRDNTQPKASQYKHIGKTLHQTGE